ncbi:hypothetical protein [Selenihalanaerobacter shriftii]|uniref:Uncharacterized protein n=1 Tax=Selenihalanaerobacter shriftii TaxID=142842 RepID=A0A1T4R8P5_9FIRM|nr:hypothetical protein [Selenihalanaerobacter shriftii]SKA12295.1 hypothetical protein SAMN02745118_02854 [Selenihalanaerobacter shriftii]
MTSKPEFTNDLECLMFSDMVYEDFENGVDGDGLKSLKEIFSNNERFHDPVRKRRFEEYKRSVATMDNWEFMMKSGDNDFISTTEEDSNTVKEYFEKLFLKEFDDSQLSNQVNWIGNNIDEVKQIYKVASKSLINEFFTIKPVEEIIKLDVGGGGGFYAAAFKHKQRNEILITYRGTNQNIEDHALINWQMVY